MSRDLKKKFDVFLALADKNVGRYPWLVVIAMHEYFRHIFPSDPYLPFSKKISSTARINAVLDNNISLLRQAGYLGSYFGVDPRLAGTIAAKYQNSIRMAKEKATQQVYGALWDKFDVDMYLKDTTKIVLERFRHSGFDFSSLRNKVILDLGCGSGRFTIALAHLTRADRKSVV